jgi:predicted ATPase
LSPARENLERSLARHDPSHQGAYVSYDTTQPAISCLSHLSWALWYGGFPDQALERSREALAAAQELSHPYSQGYAQNFAAVLHCLRREPQDTRARAEEAIALANDHGFPFWAAMGSVLRSWALIQQGRGEDALAAMQQGLDAFERIGASLGRAAFLTLLAESHAKLGRPDEGLRVLAEALAVARATGERLFESEIYRLQGELTLQQSSRNGRADAGARGSASKAPAARAARQEAEESLLNAMEIAAAQHLKPVELRAAVSLSRLWRQQKRSAEAQALLSRLCASFSEGFETHELQEARRLLRELAQDAS